MSTVDRLAGKVAVITGGASGIGLATARRFVAEGARVVIGDVNADALAAAERELGAAATAVRCDVRADGDVAGLMATAESRFGGLHVAFANAGVGSLGLITDSDAADWMRVMEVNLLGPMLTVKHAAPRMPENGSIIITASLNAVQPAAGMSAYCCSKAALAMLAQVAALELGPRGIRVNAIGPGLVRTPLSEGMWLAPALVAEFADNAPLAAAITPDDVAALVAFLASDDASRITGTLQLVDGGAHTRRYPDLLARFAEAAAAAQASRKL
jgi:NAD(P)-dependent dehydrogenase (short-subunit alcohol dehydrogenase family)